MHTHPRHLATLVTSHFMTPGPARVLRTAGRVAFYSVNTPIWCACAGRHCNQCPFTVSTCCMCVPCRNSICAGAHFSRAPHYWPRCSSTGRCNRLSLTDGQRLRRRANGGGVLWGMPCRETDPENTDWKGILSLFILTMFSMCGCRTIYRMWSAAESQTDGPISEAEVDWPND